MPDQVKMLLSINQIMIYEYPQLLPSLVLTHYTHQWSSAFRYSLIVGPLASSPVSFCRGFCVDVAPTHSFTYLFSNSLLKMFYHSSFLWGEWAKSAAWQMEYNIQVPIALISSGCRVQHSTPQWVAGTEHCTDAKTRECRKRPSRESVLKNKQLPILKSRRYPCSRN